jgi:glycogen synthase
MKSPCSPRHILMTADTVGGVWTYALELARALGAHGIEVTLATMGGPITPAQREELQQLDSVSVRESAYRLPWMEQPWDDVKAAGEWLLELSSRVAPDLVHLNEPVYASLPWTVPSLTVAHSCVLSWWEAVWNTPAPQDWNRYRDAMRQGLASAGEVVAPSPWMLQKVRRHYGVSRGRVIRNGRDSTEYRPGPKSSYVFAAGRLWDSAKNLLALDAAAADLEWPVYVAGESRSPDGNQPLSAQHLHVLGRISSQGIAHWLRHACIYAFPARYEPFGLSVLEAALSGCALVLSDIPTLRELWDGAAIFIPPEEPSTLRLAIQALMEDSSLRQALTMRARRRSLALTPERMALSYLAAYSDLLARPEVIQEETACAS